MWYYLLFLLFNILINFIDITLILFYIVFVYIYLLSPIYYLFIYILGSIKFLLPFLFIYYLLCYYTIRYRGYRIFNFFGYSLIPLKYKLYYYKIILLYNPIYYIYIIFILTMLCSFCLFNLFYWWLFILLCYLYISLFYMLYKILYKKPYVNTLINILLIYLLYIYINIFSSLQNVLDKNHYEYTSIFELYNTRLNYRVLNLEEPIDDDLRNYINNKNIIYDEVKYPINIERYVDSIIINKLKKNYRLDEYINTYRWIHEDHNLNFYYKTKLRSNYTLDYKFKATESNYNMQRKLMYEELDTYNYYMPTGHVKNKFTWFINYWKINLHSLYNNNNTQIYENLDKQVSNILIYEWQDLNSKYNNIKDYIYILFNIKKKDVISDNFDKYYYNHNNNYRNDLLYFILKYNEYRKIHEDIEHLAYNELYLLREISNESKTIKLYRDNIKENTKMIKFWENFSIERWYNAVYSVNYTDIDNWLGKNYKYVEEGEAFEDEEHLMDRNDLLYNEMLESQYDIIELYNKYYSSNDRDDSAFLNYLRESYKVKKFYNYGSSIKK